MESSNKPLQTLDVRQCVDLLRRNNRGRVALSVDALPTIVPVSYGVVGDEIVLCAGDEERYAAAMCDTVVAFEVDEADSLTGAGWSVVVRGLARDAGPPSAEGVWPIAQTWSGSVRLPLVSLSVDLIAGRALPWWRIDDGE